MSFHKLEVVKISNEQSLLRYFYNVLINAPTNGKN